MSQLREKLKDWSKQAEIAQQTIEASGLRYNHIMKCRSNSADHALPLCEALDIAIEALEQAKHYANLGMVDHVHKSLEIALEQVAERLKDL